MLVFLLATALAETPQGCVDFSRAAGRPPSLPVGLESTSYPLVVWYDPAYNNKQEALAAETLAAAELSWEIQVNQLGFRPPTLPDLGEDPDTFDIYLMEFALGAAFVTADTFTDQVPGDGYNSVPSYMVVDNRLPLDWIEGFITHEFNHACQWSYDFTELSLPIWEGTATAAQGWTLGPDGAWDEQVRSFQQIPWFPSLLSDASYTYYGYSLGYYFEYGAALWVMYLDEKHGLGDGTLGPVLWDNTSNEGYAQEPDVVDAFITTSGLSLGEGMNELAMVRFLTGEDWDSRGLVDAAAWGKAKAVPATALVAADLPLHDLELNPQPYITGQGFYDLDLTGLEVTTGANETAWIRVSVSSSKGADSSLIAMWWAEDGTLGDDSDEGTAPQVELPLEGLTRIALGVTHLGTSSWDGDDWAYEGGGLSITVETFTLQDPTTTPTTSTDTGDLTDTGLTDTTEPVAQDPPDVGEDRGCGCQAVGAASGMGSLLLLPWLIRRRRATAWGARGL